MRSLPLNCPKPPPFTSTEVCYQFKLTTPMFGGGVDPGVSDASMPIRSSSIRGQLRFWWRATRGGQFETAKDLFARESEIFGNTERPSALQVAVEIKEMGTTHPCAFYPQNKSFPRFEPNHPDYALFPFQGNQREKKPIGEGRYDTVFDVKLRYPQSIELEVRTAIQAWANFGGIGARTRRGCGSLYCQDFAPSDGQSVKEWFRNARADWLLPKGEQTAQWPTIGMLMVSKGDANALKVWNETIMMLRQFRQGEGVGRNPGQQGRPGRSRFPEPESIRRETGRRLPRHQALTHMATPSFPRAEFGLPIVFHFKDEREREGDPKDTTLEPLASGRMSSPLILKPLALNNGQFMKLVMTLKVPALDGVRLMAGKNSQLAEFDRKAIRYVPQHQDANSPLRYSKTGSALDAFLEYVQKTQGAWEKLV